MDWEDAFGCNRSVPQAQGMERGKLVAQVWKCNDCKYVTWIPKEAGDHERYYNNGELAEPIPGAHYMEDVGE